MKRSNSATERDLLVPLNQRNYILGIVNGVLFMTGNRLVDITTVMPLLLLRLSGLTWMAGMGHALTLVAQVVPQVIASRWVDTAEHKRPIFRWCAAGRFIGTLGMGASVYYAWHLGHSLALALLLGFFTIRIVIQGVSSQSFTYIVANSVPTTKRGSFWKWRQLIGLVLVIVITRPVVRKMLAADAALEFPQNYAALIALSAVIMGIGWLVFAFVEEPAASYSIHQLTMRQHLARGVRLLKRDQSFRRLLRVRILLSAAGAISPFLITFAVEEWQFEDVDAAYFLAVQIVGQMIGCWIAGHVSDRLGNRRVLVTSAATILATSMVALVGGTLAPSSIVNVCGYGVRWQMIVLTVCFLGSGLFMAQLYPGYINYLMDIAPRRKLPSYMGFASLYIVPIALAPVGYGWLIEIVDYSMVFAIASILGFVGLLMSLRISEPRDDIAEEIADELAGSI